MAACFYIVVEGDDPGYDIFVNGQALARQEASLETLAQELGVPPLLEFYSADRNAMAVLDEQGAGNPAWYKRLPDPQWFSPESGLRTVNALLNLVESDLNALGEDTCRVLQELREYQRVLQKTQNYKLRWHLAVSWE